MSRRGDRAFSMIESVMSIIVVGSLCVAVLKGLSAAAASSRNYSDRARAQLVAIDLVSEIATKEYTEAGVAGGVLGPEAGEKVPGNRLLFDDVDDYHGLIESPPVTADSRAIPGTTGWTRETVVVWVTLAAPTAVVDAETNLKRITVTVKKGSRVLARAHAYRASLWTPMVRPVAWTSETSLVKPAESK